MPGARPSTGCRSRRSTIASSGLVGAGRMFLRRPMISTSAGGVAGIGPLQSKFSTLPPKPAVHLAHLRRQWTIGAPGHRISRRLGSGRRFTYQVNLAESSDWPRWAAAFAQDMNQLIACPLRAGALGLGGRDRGRLFDADGIRAAGATARTLARVHAFLVVGPAFPVTVALGPISSIPELGLGGRCSSIAGIGSLIVWYLRKGLAGIAALAGIHRPHGRGAETLMADNRDGSGPPPDRCRPACDFGAGQTGPGRWRCCGPAAAGSACWSAAGC